VSSWFSRVAPNGRHWVGGNGTLTLGGQDDGPGQDIGAGYGPKWIDDASFLATIGADLVYISLTGARAVLNSIGCVYFDVAPDGRWMLENNDPQRIVWHDGGVWPGYSTPAISNTRWAALAHDLATLYAGTGQGQNGIAIDRPCLEPRLSGDVLVWRKDGQIFGQVEHEGPVIELTIEGEFHFWPVPVVVDGKPYVLTNTNTGRLLFYPFPGPDTKPTKGYEVARGITDFADAQAIDARFVRVVWSEKGEHRERTVDLTAPMVDLAAPATVPDIPWTSAPVGTPFDIEPMVRGSATAERDGVLWYRKGDPVNGDPWGAWLDYDETANLLGLLADSSTGQLRANGTRVNAMWFEGTRTWMPLQGLSGWSADYDCTFVWQDGTRTAEYVHVGMEAGYARFNGVDVFYRHLYDPRRRDPTNAKRKTGYLEYSYYDHVREQAWDELRDDQNGVPQLKRRVQPVPFTGKEVFEPPPRPQPYGSIAPVPGAPPTITIRDYWPRSGATPLTWQATAVTTGKVERIVWRWRKQGTKAWIKKDDDTHTTVTFSEPGTWEIGVDVYGPTGSDGTATPRLIVVTA
jgi:hypothetical protein